MEDSFRQVIGRLQGGRRCRHWALVGAAAALAVLASSLAARAQDMEAFFNEHCAACHTIGGGPFIGPDLKDVTKRQDRFWLTMFIVDPDDVIATDDAYAARIVAEAGGFVMPQIPEVMPHIAEALLDFIEAKSRAGAPPASDVPASEPSFTKNHIEQGRRLFFGETPLSAGGAACFSCHTTPGGGALGSGRLGPDLLQVYARLKGRKPLVAWLSAPPTPTMEAAYRRNALKPEEVLALVAFFEAQAKEGDASTRGDTTQFLLFSASGAVLALLVVGGAWRRRFRAVRRPLVRGATTRRELCR